MQRKSAGKENGSERALTSRAPLLSYQRTIRYDFGDEGSSEAWYLAMGASCDMWEHNHSTCL